jgi:chemotaxis protein methyltransferase WspC
MTAAQVSSYAARLSGDSAEFQALLDEVVVPETWFFRGGDLFSYLAGRVRASGRGRAAPFRAVSLPCSTGEEPYSLVLALAEIGMPPTGYRIDGVDISLRSIQQARKGVFSELSFRQTDADLRRRYFRPVSGGWELLPSLRDTVCFQVGNLLDPRLLILEPPYDLVFCRNLFIYLTLDARRQALASLLRLMAADGLLCLGHAEPLPPDEDRFERTGPDNYFLYRRIHRGNDRVTRWQGDRVKEEVRASREPRSSASVTPSLCHLVTLSSSRGELLSQARREADAGQLDQALELCRLCETRYGPSAEAHCLMGIVHQARRDRAAALASFRKALYLEPDHREALVHLMLLYQVQGEQAQAALLRRRLERLAPGEVQGSGGET